VSGAIWQKFSNYPEALDFTMHEVEETAAWYYGVFNGQGGQSSGVYSDMSEAHNLINGVSGAAWKKFRSSSEAKTDASTVCTDRLLYIQYSSSWNLVEFPCARHSTTYRDGSPKQPIMAPTVIVSTQNTTNIQWRTVCDEK
jgi:viroplasmin and RNaseH domain-containing protein